MHVHQQEDCQNHAHGFTRGLLERWNTIHTAKAAVSYQQPYILECHHNSLVSHIAGVAATQAILHRQGADDTFSLYSCQFAV